MPFAAELKNNLHLRQNQVPHEFASGGELSEVLTRDLLAVEAAADTDMLTSILLLEGNTLRHGAAPRLPSAYCDAIDGSEIGPAAGSCGTAAFLGRAVYVTDVESDPLWADYRSVALAHGLRACWSTPILDSRGAVIGTFAIYHLTPRSPTVDEVEAIGTIAGHAARAIMWWRDRESRSVDEIARRAPLRIVSPAEDRDGLLLDIASKFEDIGLIIELALDALGPNESDGAAALRRAGEASLKAAARVRTAVASSE